MGSGDRPPGGTDDPSGDDEKTVWIPPNRPEPAQSQWNPAPAPSPGTSAPYPPNQWQPPTGNRGQWKWIALAAVAVLAIVGSVVVIARSGSDGASTATPGPTASSADAEPAADESGDAPHSDATDSDPDSDPETEPEPTGLDALKRYLLTPAEVQDVLGEPVRAVADGTEPIVQTTDHPDCGGALLMPTTYGLDGAGHTDVVTQLLQNPDAQGAIRVLQWVIGFRDGPAAAAYLANENHRWDRCRFKTVSLTEDGQTSQWSMGVPQYTGSQLSMLVHQRGAGEWWCQQAGVARGTVVVGAQVCSAAVPSAMKLTGKMAMKVSG
ncbi:sensor domain-containing protein [[Mycobacterium] wendilense]|uniref:Sensor domain-containing protein n=1 Tax=[Mycobacterium] wendilense TaxID=3064284 RepID=A0ABN9P157_9MYCO|nr:sensor domain-containing protein [Mycolicibacterium sp. MU0050]CAJ1581742.1 sensor domain-containing protein [Mycolicibacterium sp. MU0050]